MTTEPTSPGAPARPTQLPAFEWAYPGAEAFEWAHDTEHWKAPMAPMEAWIARHWGPGTDRAWAEVGMEPPPVFYRFQIAGPFLYARQTMPAPQDLMRMGLRYREVAKANGGGLRFWREFCRPRIEHACAEIAAWDSRRPLADLAGEYAYGFHQTFTVLALIFEASMQVGAMLGGDHESLDALEVTQGGGNPSQAIDAEIWELAQLARRTPAVARVLGEALRATTLSSLRAEPAASEFMAAFDALVERHGTRSQSWDLISPTWRERPEAPLALVRAQLAANSLAPREVAAASEARRDAARERALAALPSDQHAAFQGALDQLQGLVDIREDRAYWQMTLGGEVRGALLRIGAALAAKGRIGAADDLLFLEPRDIQGASGDLRALVAQRRAEWTRWFEFQPPEKIGTLTAPQEQPASSPRELHGSPASRGVVSGPARIIRTPEEGARLRAGDILVCAMSTPAWTPLFAIVAGVVTETGGPLSHPAITAREYGIPAVVAVKGATRRISEGQLVTVDGAAGTVALS
jgi:pyruvate,water dikinase